MIKGNLLESEVNLTLSEVRLIENHRVTGQSPFQLIFVTSHEGIPVRMLGSTSRKGFLKVLDAMGYSGPVSLDSVHKFLISQLDKEFTSNLHTDSKGRLALSYGTFRIKSFL